MTDPRVAVVIEDDPRISDLVRMLLRRIGFQVHVAADGETGLDFVREKRPDLLITDMLLPKLHGVEVCKAVRSDPALSHVRIIAMTAVYKKMKYGVDIRDARVDAFLEKPFDIHELQHIVWNMFPDLKDGSASSGVEAEVREHGSMQEAVRRISLLWSQYVKNPVPDTELETLHGALLGLDELAVRDDNLAVAHACSRLKRLVASIRSAGGGLLQTTEDAFNRTLAALHGMVGTDKGASAAPEQVQPVPSSHLGEERSEKGCHPEVESGISLWWISPAPEKARRYVSQFSSLGFRLQLADLSAGTPDTSDAMAVVVDLGATNDLRSLRIQVSEWQFRLGESTTLMALVPPDTCDPDSVMKIMEAGATHVLAPPLDVWGVVQMIVDETRPTQRVQGRILVLDSTSEAAPVRGIPSALGYSVRVVSQVGELMDMIQTFDPELILLGERFDVLSGSKLVRFVRKTVPGRGILAVVTREEMDMVGEMIQAGAAGVLTPHMPDPLLAAVLDTELKYCRARRRLSGRFPDTGLMLHSAFLDSVARILRNSGESPLELQLGVLSFPDMDSLLLEMGYPFVTRVLCCVDYMVRMWTGNAVCAQLPGGEVAIALPGFDREGGREWMSSFVSSFSRLRFVSGRDERAVPVQWGIAAVSDAEDLPRTLARVLADSRGAVR